jgi:hypothetical protein
MWKRGRTRSCNDQRLPCSVTVRFHLGFLRDKRLISSAPASVTRTSSHGSHGSLGSQPPPVSYYHRKRAKLLASSTQQSANSLQHHRSPSELSHASQYSKHSRDSQGSRASRASRVSRSSLSSIPVSAIISPHAPSTGITPHPHASYHMRDPRKPLPIRPTPWTLVLPSPLPSPTGDRRSGVGWKGALKKVRRWRAPALKLGRQKDPEMGQAEKRPNGSSRGDAIGWRSWTSRGGSPLHAWLFFLGFVLFPAWWIASFLSVPRGVQKASSKDKEGGGMSQDEFGRWLKIVLQKSG